MAEIALRYLLYFGTMFIDLLKMGLYDSEWREPFDSVNVRQEL